MAKKQFTSNFQDIFKPTVEPEKPTIIVSNNENKPSNISEEIVRTTILLNKSTYETIKAIAYWERLQIKDILNSALESIINKYSPEQLEMFNKEYKAKTP